VPGAAVGVRPTRRQDRGTNLFQRVSRRISALLTLPVALTGDNEVEEFHSLAFATSNADKASACHQVRRSRVIFSLVELLTGLPSRRST
jgi:hypothetical protein